MLALVAGHDVAWGPVGVKTGVTLVLVLLLARNRRFLSVPRGLWLLMGLLTLANAGRLGAVALGCRGRPTPSRARTTEPEETA